MANNNNNSKKSSRSKKNDSMSTSNICCMILMIILIVLLVKNIRQRKKENFYNESKEIPKYNPLDVHTVNKNDVNLNGPIKSYNVNGGIDQTVGANTGMMQDSSKGEVPTFTQNKDYGVP